MSPLLCQLPVRHLILALSTVCLTLIFSNSILLNFTIICMHPIADNHQMNSTDFSSTAEFSPLERSALFSAGAVGAILGGFPINRLVAHFTLRHVIFAYLVGGIQFRHVITGYGLISALSTLLTPLAYSHSQFGFWALIISRILQGTSFPAEDITISWITRKWATVSSTGTFLMLISCHFQLGPMLTMPLAGHFCESNLGWAAIYYLQGAITLCFFLLFFLFFRDHPSEHPWIGDTELKLIQIGKVEEEAKGGRVPYRAILSDWALWLVLLAYFSDELAFQLYNQLGPYYLNKVLGIGVAGTGLYAALPFLVSLASKVISGPINDQLLSKFLNEHVRIKLFTAISQYGIAISFVCLAFLPLYTKSLWLILSFYASLNMFTGLDFLGLVLCTQKIALRHSELIMVWVSILSSSISLFMPAIISAVAPNDSFDQWMRVLASIGLIVALCVTAFIVAGKTRPRKWAIEGEKHSENFIKQWRKF